MSNGRMDQIAFLFRELQILLLRFNALSQKKTIIINETRQYHTTTSHTEKNFIINET